MAAFEQNAGATSIAERSVTVFLHCPDVCPSKARPGTRAQATDASACYLLLSGNKEEHELLHTYIHMTTTTMTTATDIPCVMWSGMRSHTTTCCTLCVCQIRSDTRTHTATDCMLRVSDSVRGGGHTTDYCMLRVSDSVRDTKSHHYLLHVLLTATLQQPPKRGCTAQCRRAVSNDTASWRRRLLPPCRR